MQQKNGFNKIIQKFNEMDDVYLSERANDLKDMKKKIIAKLQNKKEIDLSNLPKNTIILAKELTTSDTAKLDLKNVSGIITLMGGINSHISIMARTHEIPGVVGIDITKIEANAFVAINGKTGEVILNPSKEEIKKLEEIRKNDYKEKEELEEYKYKKTKTQDNHSVELVANIGIPEDADIAYKNTAEGIGLFRSEFLYMNESHIPQEEEQFENYMRVVKKMEGKQVIIRTLDIGGDKDLKYINLPKEKNPFLGYRAIRICLDNIELFKVQLRAILRASAYGNLSLMLPMISSIGELKKAKSIIEEVKQELDEKNILYKKDIKVGIMIEIPSAAIMAESLAKECDFFSIGTNDLIQYTLAAERGNEKIANVYTKYHPALIRLIKLSIDGAHKNNIPCGMCGEAAGNQVYIPLLIGLGLDEFSMNPNKILRARKLIRNLKYSECKKLAEKILKMITSDEIENELKGIKNK